MKTDQKRQAQYIADLLRFALNEFDNPMRQLSAEKNFSLYNP